MNNALLSKILLKIESLPSMPEAGAKALALLKEPNASVAEIEKVLRHDPGLTANVLKLANSVYFGIPSKVGSVKQAFILLGADRFTQLVLATCTCSLMDKAVEGYESPPGELWRHSIAVANTAEALAKYNKIAESKDVFTPALLHDIGKLVLGRLVKEEFESIRNIVAKGVPYEIAENMVLETDHAEIGAQILSQWSFPQDFILAVRFHHNPDAVHNANLLIDLVYLANLLSHKSRNSKGNERQSIWLSPAIIKRLNIEPDQLELISEKVVRWTDKLSKELIFP
jgi:putative nucleotidyltransferase with HDIG domain